MEAGVLTTVTMATVPLSHERTSWNAFDAGRCRSRSRGTHPNGSGTFLGQAASAAAAPIPLQHLPALNQCLGLDWLQGAGGDGKRLILVALGCFPTEGISYRELSSPRVQLTPVYSALAPSCWDPQSTQAKGERRRRPLGGGRYKRGGYLRQSESCEHSKDLPLLE